MISSEHEYRKAREEVEQLTRWLARLEADEDANNKRLTAGGIRKMISRVQAEIAEYEIAGTSMSADSKADTEPGKENAAAPENDKD